MIQSFWDERYSSEEYIYGKEPNLFFKSAIDQLEPGRILIPGAGEGRDAVYAAGLGWEVTALDASVEGRRKAMELAREAGVSISYLVMDVTNYEVEPDHYDAAGLIFFHLPKEVRVPFHNKVIASLKSGGVFILQSFHPMQIGNSSGGPKDPDMLVSAALLSNEILGLRKRQTEEKELVLSEGKYHEGIAMVTNLIGSK